MLVLYSHVYTKYNSAAAYHLDPSLILMTPECSVVPLTEVSFKFVTKRGQCVRSATPKYNTRAGVRGRFTDLY